jgi:hypothetical protein
MRLDNLAHIVRVHFIVALLVGLVVGTFIGLGEGVTVLLSEGVLGRYNELVAWAIVVDASAMIAVEFGLAIISGLIFFLTRRVPILRRLVALQLGETVFVMAFALGLWSQGTAAPAAWVTNPVGVILPPALVGLLLGEFALATSMWIMEHAPLVRRLHARDWLILEAAVVMVAIAFGFIH